MRARLSSPSSGWRSLPRLRLADAHRTRRAAFAQDTIMSSLMVVNGVCKPSSIAFTRMLDTSMTLADGRVLAYTDCGAPGGPLVFYFHGAPTSRLDLVALDVALQALGVRVVS